MTSFFKALVVTVFIAMLAGLGIYSQYWSGTAASGRVALSKEELNLFAEKNLGVREKTQFSSDAEARKKFLERLGKQLSLAAEAQRRGLGDSDDVKAIEALGSAQVLQDAYMKAHPELAKEANGGQPTPEEVQAYVAAHGDEIARYQQALAAQSEGMPAPKPEELAVPLMMAEKARAEGLDTKDEETRLQLKLNRYGALIQALLPKLEEETKYTDEEVDAYYRENAASGQLDKLEVQHILFATVPMPNPANPFGGGETPDPVAKRQLAEQVLERIRNGEDFTALAKQYSEEPGAAEKGGDLGLSERFKFVPEFEEAAWKLQPGQVSDIVKTDYGFHIIKVNARQPAPELTPELKERLKDILGQRRFEERVDEIAKRNPVVLPDDFAVAAPPPQPPMQGFPHGGMPPQMPEGAHSPDDGHGH